MENGGILTLTVPVGEGDIVLDASVAVVSLQPGVRLIDANGQPVTYASGAVDMLQVSYTTHYKTGMRWPVGSSPSQQDLTLWDAVNCDPIIPAVITYGCERTAGRTYLRDTGVRYIMVPGYVDILNPLMPGAYPANRLLSDGRLQKDVPHLQWTSLPEIIERSIGLGPYYVESWQRGSYIRLARNPYYILGQPVTPKLEFRFYPSETIQLLLIDRTIHVLDPSSLGTISDLLMPAIDSGLLKGYSLTSGTWEHIDLNLDVYS